MIASQNRLAGLTRQLLAEWERAKQSWSDAKSLEFEKRFLDDLVTSVNQAVAHIDALERILDKIHADCD